MIKNEEVVRLSALLYVDNTKDIDIDTDRIIKKVIFSILLDNKNKEINLGNLCREIKEKNKLIFTTDHLLKIIKKYSLDFVLKKEKRNFKSTVYLNPDKYTKLNDLVYREENTWENILTKFYNSHEIKMELPIAKEILNRHLYDSTKKSYEEYRKLFHKSTEIKDKKWVGFNEIEINIINLFHSWEDTLKNDYLQRIYSIGLELAFISNNSIDDEKLKSILNKNFFLDTNIVYRSLGINGPERKEIILNFLDTCLSHKSIFYISEYTEKEFKESLKRKIKILKKYDSGAYIPEKIFNRYTDGYGIFHYYNKWKSNNKGLSINMFEAEIFSNFFEFKKKYNIEYHKEINLSCEDDLELKEMFDSYTYKMFQKMEENSDKVFLDLKNIMLLNKLRNGNNQDLIQTDYFFISTDQKLKYWEYERSNYLPTILLPSQWLNIILRYGKRTTNDYQSFSSLLGLRNHDGVFSEEQLFIICDGIKKVNKKVSESKVLDYMIDKKFKKLILETDDGDDFILEKSEEMTKDYLQEEMEILQKNNQEKLIQTNKINEEQIEKLRKEVNDRMQLKELEKIKKIRKLEKKKNDEIDFIIKKHEEEAHLKDSIEKDSVKKIETLQKKLEEKDNKLKQVKEKEMKNKKLLFFIQNIVLIFIGVVGISYFLDALFLSKLNFNPISNLIDYIELMTNKTKQNWATRSIFILIPTILGVLIYIPSKKLYNYKKEINNLNQKIKIKYETI